MAACLVPIGSSAIVVYGNSDLWSAAFLALGTRYGWPVAALAIKPAVVPLGLLWVRDRRAWAGAAVVAVAAIPFGALWLDWLAAMANLEGASVLRSVPVLPWLAIPLVAWAGRTLNAPTGGSDSLYVFDTP